MNWMPISLKELDNIIETSVTVMDAEVLYFWNSIKIVPEKDKFLLIAMKIIFGL